MRNSNGIVKGIGAILCAVVIAAGVCCTGFAARDENGKWFGNGDLSTWHWSDKVYDEKPDNDKPDDNKPADEMRYESGVVVGDFVGSGVSLLSAVLPRSAYAANGIDPLSDSACVLTATVEPADADNKKVDYSIAWKNSTSAWAVNKNVADYLSIVQSSDGSLTATLTCKQAFGEQAVVTVISRAVSNVKATVTVDYRKKLTSSTAGIFDGDTSSTKTWNVANSLFTPQTSFVDNFGVGTLNDTVVSHKMTITTASQLRGFLSNQFTSPSAKEKFNATREYDGTVNGSLHWIWLFNPGYDPGSGTSGTEGLFSFCSEVVDYGEWEILSSEYNKVRTCLAHADIDFVVTIKTQLTYGGTVTQTYNVNVLDSSLEIMPTAVKLSNSSIVF